MDSIKGRVTDLIRLPDGTVLSGDYLSTIFDEFPDAVCSFQVLQKADYSIIISVVPNASFEKLEDILMTVKTVLRHKTYGLVPVRFEKLDEIPTDRGKTRFVISEVSRP
jgi:phenylacetate-CoA ligase